MSVTATIIQTTVGRNGQKTVRASFLLDNAYPVAGYALTPAQFGLNRFKPASSGVALQQPDVKNIAGQPVLFRVVAQQLIASYPSGGATASPTTPAAPIVTAGATPVTSSAATGVLTPGVGKDLANASDLSSVTVVLEATGY